MKSPGRVGSSGTSSGSSARTRRGVISTISSVCSARAALLLNRLPMIGSELSIGIAWRSVCDRLFISPAIANDWPSRSSTSVSARRVFSAGMRKPERMTPLLKSSELTSGLQLEANHVAGDRRPERQADAELLVLDA